MGARNGSRVMKLVRSPVLRPLMTQGVKFYGILKVFGELVPSQKSYATFIFYALDLLIGPGNDYGVSAPKTMAINKRVRAKNIYCYCKTNLLFSTGTI